MVTARSAEAVTDVDTVELLFPGLGSLVVEEMAAVLDSEPACAGAVTTAVIGGAVAPVARAGRVQVTDTLARFVQVHPLPPAETKVTPAGRVSVTVTEDASEGPLLRATRE